MQTFRLGLHPIDNAEPTEDRVEMPDLGGAVELARVRLLLGNEHRYITVADETGLIATVHRNRSIDWADRG